MNILKTKSNIISYTVNKALNSDCYICVNSGEVVVNAPWYFSKKQIQNIIEEKTYWISEKLKEHQLQNNSYTNKASICILGVNYQVLLYYKNVKLPSITLSNTSVNVILPHKYKKLDTNELLKILIDKLYDKISEHEIERAMEKTRLLLGFAPEDYSIQRLENGQIGMCNYNEKKIIISPDIVKYDRDTIEYIVLHEFCHLKYKIHAKGFWEMIKKHMPNYKICKEKVVC